MGPEEIKSAITGWCTTDELQLVEDRTAESGGGPFGALSGNNAFALGLRAAAAGGGTVPIHVLLERGADRVTVRSESRGGVSGDEARQLLDARPALVSTEGGAGGEGTVVVGHVYLDGFNRQAFVQVVREVAKTSRLLAGGDATADDRVAGGDALGANAAAASVTPRETAGAVMAQPEGQPEKQPDVWSPQPAQASPQPYADAQPVTPAAQSLPAPSFGGAAQQGGYGGYAPLSGQPAPQAQPQQQPQSAGGGFAPTHTVPPQGLQAWAAPDPTGAVVATLGGGLPIQVTEVRGAWAQVLCSNGWRGWVDGRIIGVAR